MRFHFDIVDDTNGRVIDLDGIEFADLATMRQQALRAAGTMVSELTEFSLEPWTMIIRDDQRQAIATLTFSANYDDNEATGARR